MNERVAIVTGASQGIGRATAIRLAQDFSAVVLAARNLDNPQETAASVAQRGAQAFALDVDLSEPASALQWALSTRRS